MSVMTNLDPEKIQDVNNDPDYETKFLLKDGYYKGDIRSAKEFKTDKDAGEGAQYNWKNVESRSFKNC